MREGGFSFFVAAVPQTIQIFRIQMPPAKGLTLVHGRHKVEKGSL
jgi:hypothetical protein